MAVERVNADGERNPRQGARWLGAKGTPRRDRGFVPDCLFAGNRGWIKASRFASRFSTSFCRISIAIGHDSTRLSRLILVSEREPGWPATFVPFVTRIRLFPRCISRARTNLSLPRILSLFFLLFFFVLPLQPLVLTLPKGKKSAEREIVKFLGNERQTFYFATIQQSPPLFVLTTIRSVLPARCQDLALSRPPKTNGKIQLGGRGERRRNIRLYSSLRNKMSRRCARGRHKLSFLNYRRFVNFYAVVVASPGRPWPGA